MSSSTLKPGVVTGADYATLVNAAKAGGYALPAVNVVGTHSLNAVMEAAANANSDIILQLSNSGAAFYAGAGMPDGFKAKVMGSVAAAQHAHLLAEYYGICVVMHTDHANKALIPWVEAMLDEGEKFYERTGKPLYSSHMLDLSADPIDFNLSECARVLERMAKIDMSLEIELGVTGGEEDGIGSEFDEAADNAHLYTQPEDVLRAYDLLDPIGHFSVAASFGNVHGVYKPGNVKLRPEILRNSQSLVQQTHGTAENPLHLVFHGGSGSEKAKIEEAVGYGVFKMNIDTDTQFAFSQPIGAFVDENHRAFEYQVDPDDGTPYKKFYDPRKLLRQGELGMVERLQEACEDLGSRGALDRGLTVFPEQRVAGAGMHFTSLPGTHGIGDIGDASRDFLRDLRSMHLSVWQFLPVGPTAYGDSPYQPLSAFAGNEMLIGLDPLIRVGGIRPEEAEPLKKLSRESVDYGQLIAKKLALLKLAARRFVSLSDSALKADYDEFLHRTEDAWLDDYAMFRVLKTLHDERSWTEWEPKVRRRDPDALKAMREKHSEAIETLKVIQFLFDRQWRMLRQRAREAGVILFGDTPIYIALDSADAWANPELLQVDESGKPTQVAGVPPDYFSEDGQVWGNPLYDWKHHRDTGYAWWVKRISHAAERMDLLRIDHFRGFEAYWSVPAGEKTARKGQWIKGPGDGLFDTLKKELGPLPIVAEDLGEITPEVDALRKGHGFPGMQVLQFAVSEPKFKLDDIEENTVCYTGTHDNDTTQGWFSGNQGDTRTAGQIRFGQTNVLKMSSGTPGTIHMDMIRMAFESRARLAIAPLQDYLGLGSEARLNTPGTTLNNWRWRLQPDQLTADLRVEVSSMVDLSSRR